MRSAQCTLRFHRRQMYSRCHFPGSQRVCTLLKALGGPPPRVNRPAKGTPGLAKSLALSWGLLRGRLRALSHCDSPRNTASRDHCHGETARPETLGYKATMTLWIGILPGSFVSPFGAFSDLARIFSPSSITSATCDTQAPDILDRLHVPSLI